MNNVLTESQKQIKEQFMKERGEWIWSDFWQSILLLDEEFVKGYSKLSSLPNQKGFIEPKVKEFIYIALDDSITHFYEPGLRGHIQQAFTHGASKEEVLEVMEIAGTIGSHTLTMGIPVLADALQKRGADISSMKLTEKQKALKEEYIGQKRGDWSDDLENILKLDEDIFDAFFAFSYVPWKSGSLDPKTKELLFIAINVSPTTLQEPGIKIHVENALNAGATKEEILEVFEMVSCLGVHSVANGLSILNEEWDKHKSQK